MSLRVAVVGAGIAGLAAAHRLRTRLGPTASLIVLEQRDRIGGVLRTVDLAGAAYDVGAEAFLARRPEVPALLAELGLADRLVAPGPAGATIRAAGRAAALPAGTVLGVPTSGARLAGLLSADGLAAVAAEPTRPLRWSAGDDIALGGLLRTRFGAELVDRLVDPLLGGVYAGRVDALGLRATMPALAAALDAGAPSLTAAADTATPTRPVGPLPSPLPHPGESAAAPRRAADPAPPTPREPPPGGTPVFGALRGGYRVLLDALADATRADLRLGTTVRGLERSASGWLLVLGPTTAPEALEVDAVVLAVPAPALARLLGPVAPAAAAAAATVELASSVVVAMAFAAADVPRLSTSGTLVAVGEPLSVKGVTHSTTKWPHLADDGLVRVRASLGRFGEAATLQVDDAGLVARVRADLATLDGITARPVAVHVQRWGGGLPQYAVGHLARMAALEAGLPVGIAVAGAALRGVGVPACIGSGRLAADRVVRSAVTID